MKNYANHGGINKLSVEKLMFSKLLIPPTTQKKDYPSSFTSSFKK